MTSPLSSLERSLIQLVASENWKDFHVDALQVKRRENTGAGRYTYFDDQVKQGLPDGTYTAQGKLLQMDGVRDGLAFMVDVTGGLINYLEIAVYGNESWDGVERTWQVL